MLKFINLKKISIASLLAFIMTSSLIINPAASAKKPEEPKKETEEPKKVKACKNNNGIGNNHDIEIILPSETLTIRIDPGNQGQMNKFAGYLATAKNIDESTFKDKIIPQIEDAEKHAKHSNPDCPTSSVSPEHNFSAPEEPQNIFFAD